MNRFDLKQLPPSPFAWVAALLVVSAFAGCSEFKKGYDDNFKKSYVSSFATSCTDAATKGGAAEERVKPICGCMAQYMVDHNTPAVLTKMSLDENSPESQGMLKAAGAACVPAAH